MEKLTACAAYLGAYGPVDVVDDNAAFPLVYSLADGLGVGLALFPGDRVANLLLLHADLRAALLAVPNLAFLASYRKLGQKMTDTLGPKF